MSVQTPPTPPTPSDGRSARAQRTREAIVDACIALVEEGELRPTAPRVAERAQVSVRSVFQHFDDLPSLHIAVAQRIAERLAVLLVPIDSSLPFDGRVDEFVQHRAAVLEAVTPFRRAAEVHGPFAAEVRNAVRVGTTYLRDEVATAFQPELVRAREQAGEAESRTVLDGLSTVLSWPAWNALRTDSSCSVEQAKAATTRLVRGLLSPFSS